MQPAKKGVNIGAKISKFTRRAVTNLLKRGDGLVRLSWILMYSSEYTSYPFVASIVLVANGQGAWQGKDLCNLEA